VRGGGRRPPPAIGKEGSVPLRAGKPGNGLLQAKYFICSGDRVAQLWFGVVGLAERRS